MFNTKIAQRSPTVKCTVYFSMIIVSHQIINNKHGISKGWLLTFTQGNNKWLMFKLIISLNSYIHFCSFPWRVPKILIIINQNDKSVKCVKLHTDWKPKLKGILDYLSTWKYAFKSPRITGGQVYQSNLETDSTAAVEMEREVKMWRKTQIFSCQRVGVK